MHLNVPIMSLLTGFECVSSICRQRRENLPPSFNFENAAVLDTCLGVIIQSPRIQTKTDPLWGDLGLVNEETTDGFPPASDEELEDLSKCFQAVARDILDKWDSVYESASSSSQWGEEAKSAWYSIKEELNLFLLEQENRDFLTN